MSMGLSVIILMICFLLPLHLINYFKVGQQLQKTLQFIIDSGEDLQELETEGDTESTTLKDRLLSLFGYTNSVNLSPETRYQLRYFLVSFDGDGEITDVSDSHIAAVDETQAEELAKTYYKRHFKKGFVETDDSEYYYLKVENDDGSAVVGFLDCTREISNFRTFYYSSIGFAVLIVAVLMVIVSAVSHRAMEPYIENMESQKQFITNAGHELKTPLAIISANAEVLEMMNGKSEWTDSILAQVKRGTQLINELITLSRVSEAEETVLTDVDMSAVVKESTDSFRTLVEKQGKKFEVQIAEEVTVRAEVRMLGELVNILIDNASKYCDDGGTVSVFLRKRGKVGAHLFVSNDYADGAGVDYSKFFQRFYRGDTSHNSKKSGYGIGLSMAQTITEKMKGSISAKWKSGVVTFTVTL